MYQILSLPEPIVNIDFIPREINLGSKSPKNKYYSLEEKSLVIEMRYGFGMSVKEIRLLTKVSAQNISLWMKRYKGVKKGEVITLKSKV